MTYKSAKGVRTLDIDTGFAHAYKVLDPGAISTSPSISTAPYDAEWIPPAELPVRFENLAERREALNAATAKKTTSLSDGTWKGKHPCK